MEPRERLPPVDTTDPADLVALGAVATGVPEISPDVERVGLATAHGRADRGVRGVRLPTVTIGSPVETSRRAIRAFGKFVHSVAGSGHRRVLGGKPPPAAARS